MKKITINNKFNQSFGTTQEDPTDWINKEILNNSWGRPERWVREAYLVTGTENDESVLFYPDETYEESDVIERKEEPLFPDSTELVKFVKLCAEYTIEIEDITESFGKSKCKEEAKRRIAELDWVIDEETRPKLLNRQEFIDYRSSLRALIVSPEMDPQWPQRPNEVWE